MDVTEEQTQKSPSRLINFLESRRKSILSLIFLIALGLTISPSGWNDSYSLLEDSIKLWTNATRIIGDTIGTNSFQLVNLGIERFILFFQGMYDFYFLSLLALDFTVFSQTGYILSLIYIATPFLLIFSILRGLRYITSGSIKSDLTPKSLAIIFFLIPFPTNFTWLGALILILILLFWLYTNVKEEMKSRKGTSFLEVLPWKKTTFLFLSIIVLVSSVFDPNYTNVLTTMVNLDPSLIMLILVLAFIGISAIWIIVHSSVTQSPIREVFKENVQGHLSPINLFLNFLLVIFAIPLIDALIIQGLISEFVFVVINIPWLLALIFFESFAFVDFVVAILKESFDVLLEASRNIFRGLVPVSPTDKSIIGIVQPTIILTLVAFVILLIIYALFLYVYDSRIKNVSVNSRIVQYKPFVLLIIISSILALIAYYLDPNTFQALYGDPYVMNWKNDPILGFLFPLLAPFLLGVVISSILVAIFWGVLQVRKGRSSKIITSTIITNALAVSIAIIMIVPFIWMLKNSFQTDLQNTIDFQSQGLLPDPFTTRNYAQLFGVVEPGYATLEYRVVTWLFNSVIAAGAVTVFLVIFSAMAGYVLAKREFVGRRILFTLTIAIQMVPPYVQVIPLYLELDRMGFVGSLMGVILPFLIQPFSIFLCTEFMRGIPDDYLDAARIDGYSEFQIFRKIVIPLSIPVLSVMFIINIIGNWNSFMWPLLLLENSSNYLTLRTLPLGMYKINAELLEQVGVVLALATVIVIPIFIILFLAQDYIKRGVSVEGLKG